ncbi:hypothetical protein [Erythrobacter litoralis]|uniref:hypothetical protein n=1 Tax=Erythrobacter litoralis TaxID=39960 RepID=UPI0012DE64C1|nr:hypothetical protein [Erythrobacter litoralis]
MKKARHKISPENFPPYAFAFYGVAIDEAARLAVRSFMDYSDAIEDGASPSEAAGLLHDAINHCAAVSRFFWPSPKAGAVARYRGEKLRELYKIDDASPLNDRNLRNSLEHHDERIDRWIAFDPVGPIIPGPIFASHTITDEQLGHAFKVIDRDEEVYVVMGKKFKYAPLSHAIAEICLREDCI